MKTINIATSLFVIVLGLNVSPNSCGRKKIETVSSATIAKLPPGKTYELDLTRKGTLYRFKDAGTDFSRVTIRTAKGVKNFGDVLRRTNIGLIGGLIIGRPDDMRNHLGTTTISRNNYDCGAVSCKCDNTIDCINMILDGKCSDEIWCSDVTPSCFCIPQITSSGISPHRLHTGQ